MTISLVFPSSCARVADGQKAPSASRYLRQFDVRLVQMVPNDLTEIGGIRSSHDIAPKIT